jgi:hypothetical protein
MRRQKGEGMNEKPFTNCIFYVLFIYVFAILQCMCPSVDNVQLIFTPRSVPNDGGNLHERNRTVERYNETDLHDIAEILLKVALNTINLTLEVISKETYLDMIH